jgi:hypothetical protein
MTDDEVKEELGLHLAKAVLSQTVSVRDIVARMVITLCTVAISAYIALLNFFSAQVQTHSLAMKLVPLVAWLIAMLLGSAILFPRPLRFDFKRPEMLIEENAKRSRHGRNLRLAAFFVSVFGLVWMAVLFASL